MEKKTTTSRKSIVDLLVENACKKDPRNYKTGEVGGKRNGQQKDNHFSSCS